MPSAEPTSLGVKAATEAIRTGAVSPVDLVEACIAKIRAHDGELKAWAHVDAAGAFATAREREAEARAGRLRGALHGVPGGREGHLRRRRHAHDRRRQGVRHTRPTVDAAAVARIRAAGAIVIGKTVTTEFAYRDPAPTRNPWNLDHTPVARRRARPPRWRLACCRPRSALRPSARCSGRPPIAASWDSRARMAWFRSPA
jgi:Asp-tRNA(Asn)/Glu-tRNA(Gln) amidotransferase A subunit family amidase